MSSFGMINQPQLHNHGEQRNPGEGDASTSRTDGRKRRRKLACHNCHRLKTRCDFDVGTHVCRRCQTLRYSIHVVKASKDTLVSEIED